MRVIVSGADGNLGTHILKNAQFDVVKLGRSDWDKPYFNCDAFIHCAYDLKKSFQIFPDEVIDSNLTSVGRALRLCVENKIKNFIFISSCSVYGDSSKTNENITCIPNTINGHSKLLGEKMVAQFCEHHKIEPLILRVFNSYGGDDHFSVISKIINAARNRGNFTLYNGGVAERDFIHIDDVAQIVCKLVSNEKSKNMIINIGTGKALKIIEICEWVEARFGKIKMTHGASPAEALYSRADIAQLRALVSHSFIEVRDYIDSL